MARCPYNPVEDLRASIMSLRGALNNLNRCLGKGRDSLIRADRYVRMLSAEISSLTEQEKLLASVSVGSSRPSTGKAVDPDNGRTILRSMVDIQTFIFSKPFPLLESHCEWLGQRFQDLTNQQSKFGHPQSNSLLMSIPDPLGAAIMSYLPIANICALGTTCKLFQAWGLLAVREMTFVSLPLSGVAPQAGNELLQWVSRYNSKLTSVDLTSVVVPHTPGQAFGGGLGGVRALARGRAAASLGVGLGFVSRSCRRLQDLRLRLVSDDHLSACAPAWPGLLRLDVAGCDGVGDTGVEAVTSSCPLLQELVVTDCGGVSDRALCAVARHCPGLRTLVANRCRVGDAGVTAIGGRCSMLRVLRVARCGGVTDAGVVAVAENCPELRWLDTARCQGVTNRGVSAVGGHCSGVQQLQLAHCHRVSDAAVLLLLRLCRDLRLLHLAGCVDVTDTSLTALGQSCPLLEELDVGHCTGVSDATLLSLVPKPAAAAAAGSEGEGAPGAVSALRVLDVSHCPRVTGRGLGALARGCPLLVKLFMSGCDVDDDAVRAFITRPPSYKDLELFCVMQTPTVSPRCLDLLQFRFPRMYCPRPRTQQWHAEEAQKPFRSRQTTLSPPAPPSGGQGGGGAYGTPPQQGDSSSVPPPPYS